MEFILQTSNALVWICKTRVIQFHVLLSFKPREFPGRFRSFDSPRPRTKVWPALWIREKRAPQKLGCKLGIYAYFFSLDFCSSPPIFLPFLSLFLLDYLFLPFSILSSHLSHPPTHPRVGWKSGKISLQTVMICKGFQFLFSASMGMSKQSKLSSGALWHGTDFICILKGSEKSEMNADTDLRCLYDHLGMRLAICSESTKS